MSRSRKRWPQINKCEWPIYRCVVGSVGSSEVNELTTAAAEHVRI